MPLRCWSGADIGAEQNLIDRNAQIGSFASPVFSANFLSAFFAGGKPRADGDRILSARSTR